jgi:aspartyl-tRNA(Asn)/glutamyl-tRNA(Gln) amidotransferase subunit A
VVPFAWSFDTAGPMARSASDVALLLSCMTSDDPADPATLAADTRPALYPLRARGGARPLQGLRVGMPDQLFGGLEPEPGIRERYEAFAGELRSLGAELVAFAAPRSPIDNFGTDAGFAFFLDVVGTEVDLYHRQFYPARASDYEPDVVAVLGAFRARQPSAAAYLDGQRTRAELSARWNAAFAESRLDVVLQPAALVETPRRDDAATRTREIGAPMFVWNYTGFPVVGAPAGRSGVSGLPVGVQLVGRPGTESVLLQAAIDCQARFPHQRLRP